MKKLRHYISEALKVSGRTQMRTYRPGTAAELQELVDRLIDENGPDVDLNCIDVSGITEMHNLFSYSKFCGDISAWDVSNVTKMKCMFGRSQFNDDISGWNVSNVKSVSCMFKDSQFNGDISKWDVSNV